MIRALIYIGQVFSELLIIIDYYVEWSLFWAFNCATALKVKLLSTIKIEKSLF